MPANKKVGVSDIAKHAGVSIGTVSNYLNYPERVSETLKTKISRAIADLGYVPKHSNGQIPASNATDIGRKAMTQMLDHMSDADAHVHATTLIKPILVRRASTRR